MIEHGQRLHLLRDGELIDAVLSQPKPHTNDCDDACVMEVAYRGRKLQAYGADPFDALMALRGALAVDGLYMNVPRGRTRV
jgi:hypothetical protein